MSTPLTNIIDIIETIKSTEAVFPNDTVPIKHAKLGVVSFGIFIGEDINIITTKDETGKDVITIAKDLTPREELLTGLYAMRWYAFQTHDELTRKAVNFKTINFAVTGLTERAKEMMRSLAWLDKQIAVIEMSFPQAMGKSNQMITKDGDL